MVPDVSRYSGPSNLMFPPQVVVNTDVCLQFASPGSLGFISWSFIVSHTPTGHNRRRFSTPLKKKNYSRPKTNYDTRI